MLEQDGNSTHESSLRAKCGDNLSARLTAGQAAFLNPAWLLQDKQTHHVDLRDAKRYGYALPFQRNVDAVLVRIGKTWVELGASLGMGKEIYKTKPHKSNGELTKPHESSGNASQLRPMAPQANGSKAVHQNGRSEDVRREWVPNPLFEESVALALGVDREKLTPAPAVRIALTLSRLMEFCGVRIGSDDDLEFVGHYLAWVSSLSAEGVNRSTRVNPRALTHAIKEMKVRSGFHQERSEAQAALLRVADCVGGLLLNRLKWRASNVQSL